MGRQARRALAWAATVGGAALGVGPLGACTPTQAPEGQRAASSAAAPSAVAAGAVASGAAAPSAVAAGAVASGAAAPSAVASGAAAPSAVASGAVVARAPETDAPPGLAPPPGLDPPPGPEAVPAGAAPGPGDAGPGTDPGRPGRLALPARAAAVITRPAETVLLERDGREHPLGPAAEWCAVDARRGIVWLRTADGTLSGLDLWVAGPPQPLTGPVPGNSPIWIFDGAEHVPPVDPVGDDLGLQVGLEAAPALTVRTVCEGDAATYCYVDGDPARGLEPELVRRRARLEALRLFPGAITWLSARAARPSLPAPPPLPALPRLKVPKAGCEAEPDQCGTGARVRGTAYATVVVANSRGDFFHAERVLMEPGNGRIRHPDDPSRVRRADEPLDDFTLGRFDVAPDGGAWLTTDFLIDAAAGRSQPHRGRVCGWWQPPPIAW